MLFRFSLYGFLKNQRYFEPFLILYFLENHLSFAEIGILVAIREVLINVFEIPSGAIADTMGRKRSMIFSFFSYIFSFIIFTFANQFYLFIAAMAMYALGDAFRTGTHKAMIFSWLRLENMISKKTKYYGITRSWSKFGSAFSLIIAGTVLYFTSSYRFLFAATIIPYIIGIVNLWLYPQYLDLRKSNENSTIKKVFLTLLESIKSLFGRQKLRGLMIESVFYEGGFKAVKDYLQPILKNLAVGLPIVYWMDFQGKQKEAFVISMVYILLYLLSGFASRSAEKLSYKKGGESKAAKSIWRANFIIYALMVPALIYQKYIMAVVLFLFINILQNLWRPILISRFEEFTTEGTGATILSIESQAKSIGTILLAPLIGMAVDLSKASFQTGEFWPVGLAGLLLVIPFILRK